MNRTGVEHEINPTEVDVRCAVQAEDIIGESPMWCSLTGRLYRVDITRSLLHVFEPSSGWTKACTLPDLVTSVCPRKEGGLLLTLRKQFAFFDLETEKLELLGDPEAQHVGNRFNDAKCDRQGRFWAGTMGAENWDAPVGSLYRFDADRAITKIKPEVCCSNGLGWSPDSKTFYYTESFRHTMYAYDFDVVTGNLSNRRIFAQLDPNTGAFPDGLTVDADGGVWSAQPGFGRLVRYLPDGQVDQIIELPVSRGTSVIFGGADLRTLYVTTARDSLSASQLEEEPLAGCVLSLEPGVQGLPETPFAG